MCGGLETLPLDPRHPHPSPMLQSKLPERLLATRYSLEKNPFKSGQSAQEQFAAPTQFLRLIAL